MMHIPVLGVVENFSFLKCPDCGKEIKIFGESNIEETANLLGINLLGKLPLNPAYAEAADKGEFYSIENDYLDTVKEILERI
jgi:Mrp family chromosome partitioning ATPase